MSNIVEIPGEDLIVFSQKKNRRKLVMLKVHQSDWSMSFGLDAISSMSLIVCKDVERKRKYRILAEIADSTLSPSFTKIVTFLPYFYVKNNTKRALRFMEENEDADLWNDLPSGQGTAFWPYTESMRMRVKWKNSQLVSQHFDFTNIGKIVLRMENGSALCVQVKGGNNSPFRITFEKYESGDAPVRVDNLCDDLFLKLNQVNLGQVALLSPFQSVLYTWDDPTEIRELVWNVYNSKTKSYTAQFYTDGYGQETVTFRTLKRSPVIPHSNSVTKKYPHDPKFAHSVNSTSICSSSDDDSDSEAEANAPTVEKVQKNKTIVYWISYAEKKQRVLMFTQDENTFIKAKTLVDPECSKNEIFLAFTGIGLSIISDSQIPNINGRELAYISITDSAAHWEIDIGKRWKALTLELNAWMEDKYKNTSNNIQFDNYINVNFSKMHMTKPFFGKLRRTYSPGIWIHIRKSNTLTYVQGNIHRIQIDNQLHDAIFPIILRPGSKKCFSNNSGVPILKHCIEFFFLKQTKTTHDVYKKINIIIREFHINLQEEFFIRLIKDLFIKKKDDTKHSLASRLKTDLSNVYVPLPCLPDKQDRNRCNIIELVYIAPIKLHVKFLASAEARTVSQDPTDYCNIVRMIFAYASKGTFLKQAEFRLPHYERIDTIMDNEEWLLDAWKNYKSELRHQFNVLILSMTVLGNPYSYNFKCPGDSFYDTDTVVMQGDETAEKLSYNVACLLGYSCMDGLIPPIINIHFLETELSRNKVSYFIKVNSDFILIQFKILSKNQHRNLKFRFRHS